MRNVLRQMAALRYFLSLQAGCEAIAGALYKYRSTINMESPELIKFSDLKMIQSNPNVGMREDNKITYQVNVETNAIQHLDTPSFVRGPEELLRSTFKYKLTWNKDTTLEGADLEQMVSGWKNLTAFGPLNVFYRAKNTQTLQSEEKQLPLGLNQKMPLYLKMAYAARGYDCWFLSNCNKQTLKGSDTIELGDLVTLDVFPNTLDKFYAMQWGNNNKLALCYPATGTSAGCTTNRDRDGDGILASMRDEDDSTWDEDRDGVPDGVERAKGLDWRDADTDNDTLSDGYELALGIDPKSQDTDGDDVRDDEELAGYVFTYNTGKTTRIITLPGDADEDWDGFNDALEKQCGLDARAIDVNPFQITAVLDDVDNVLKPGDTVNYKTTLSNALKPGDFGIAEQIYAAGNFKTTLPNGMNFTGTGAPASLSQDIVSGGSSFTFDRDIKIANGAASASTEIANVATGKLYRGVPTTNLLGSLTNAFPLKIKIDNDNPTVIATSDVAAVKPNTALVLGGSANDPTSRVKKVEIQIDGGAWQDAALGKTFSSASALQQRSFTWNGSATQGTHTYRVRATDSVDRVGNKSQAYSIIVDGVSPTMAGNNGGRIRAVKDARDSWLITGRGTASDNASGVASVEVTSENYSAGWQNGNFNPTTGVWSVSYRLPNYDQRNSVSPSPSAAR